MLEASKALHAQSITAAATFNLIENKPGTIDKNESGI
jgi:hypothetical protein